MNKYIMWAVICNIILIIFANSSLPLALGDGMPAIQYGKSGEAQKIFSSIFESRQLAAVELLDESYGRISLFLSVYSLDPGDNLTIMVPLRTLPTDVTGKPMKEEEFREQYKIKKVEYEVIRQDMDKAMARFRKSTRQYFEYSFGSLLWTLPGEYTRQNIHKVEFDYGYEEEGKGAGGVGSSYGTPEPIQHYEFDGFSIDVFGVSSGPKLVEYLAEKGLMLSDNQILTKYSEQYIAVIESETKPPIPETDFNYLAEFAPNSLAYLMNELKNDPEKDNYEMRNLKWRLRDYIHDEVETDSNGNMINAWNIRDYMDDLVDAVFGETNFYGEVLSIDLPLDNGKMFFPLGTSAGWDNNIGKIEILFKVPEDKALALPNSKDAFFEGSHWYIVQMENANPDFDLESNIKSSDSSRKAEMELASFIYDNHIILAIIVNFIILMIFWYGIVLFIIMIKKKLNKNLANSAKRANNKDKKNALRKFMMLLSFLGISLIISIPGTLLLLLMIKPIPPGKFMQEFYTSSLLILFAAVIIIFTVGVIL